MGKTIPPAGQRRLVELWRSSSLSAAAFARSRGIQPDTFSAWVAEHQVPVTVTQRDGLFVEVIPEPAETTPTPFVVHLRTHALGFDGPPPPAWFAAVLRELESC